MRIYNNIKEIASKKNMSIREVEKQSKMTYGTLQKWNYHSPSLKNILRVCRVLDCSMEELIEEDYNTKSKLIKEMLSHM